MELISNLGDVQAVAPAASVSTAQCQEQQCACGLAMPNRQMCCCMLLHCMLLQHVAAMHGDELHGPCPVEPST